VRGTTGWFMARTRRRCLAMMMSSRTRERAVVGVVVRGLDCLDDGAALGRLLRVGGLGSGEARYDLSMGRDSE